MKNQYDKTAGDPIVFSVRLRDNKRLEDVFPCVGGGRKGVFWSRIRIKGIEVTGIWNVFLRHQDNVDLTIVDMWFPAPDAPVAILKKGISFDLVASDGETVRLSGQVT